MVYEMIKLKDFKWIPWQLRLSARQNQEAMEARSHKVARTEAQLLTHAFFDETPEVSVEGRALTASWLHRTQQVFRNALALCQARPRTVPPHGHNLWNSCTPIAKYGARL